MTSAELFRENIGDLSPVDRGILALDDMSHAESAQLLDETGGVGFHMVKENANAQKLGWDDAVNRNIELGYNLMADAKYHDTPRTTRSHVLECASAEPSFITVHTLSDLEALEAAVAGRDEARANIGAWTADTNIASLLGITILTSHSEERCQTLFGTNIKEKVMQLARLAVQADLEGIVCAGSDLGYLNADPDTAKLIKVVPGIVLSGQAKGSGQQRTMSPGEAIQEGADYLVAGSTVTKASNRQEAAGQFVLEMEEAS